MRRTVGEIQIAEERLETRRTFDLQEGQELVEFSGSFPLGHVAQEVGQVRDVADDWLTEVKGDVFRVLASRRFYLLGTKQ